MQTIIICLIMACLIAFEMYILAEEERN